MKHSRTACAMLKVLLAWFALLAFHCDIFSPRSVEQPLGVFRDPLNLSAILNYTQQSFSKTAYEDILHPDFQFIAYNDQTYGQTEEIARLKSIIVDTTVSGKWDTCAGNYQEPPDTMILCRTFHMTYRKTLTDSMIDSGETQLRLEYYSPKNTWTIRNWREIGAMSIFNPDFKQ